MAVTQHQKNIARARGLSNVNQMVAAADKASIIFPAACALMEKESRGRNVYGGDAGGMLSGFPFNVTEANFRAFWWEVSSGRQSNGVGPAQITYRGFFADMIRDGLDPWDVEDNMFKGFDIIETYKQNANGSWAQAGTWYNGSEGYGTDFAAKVKQWREWLS